MHTVQFGLQNDHIVELGANWIHGGTIANPLFTLAMQYSFKEGSGKVPILDRYENCCFAKSDGKIIDKELGQKAVKIFFEVERSAYMMFFQSTPFLSSDTNLYGYLIHELALRTEKDFTVDEQHDVRCIFNAMLNYLRFHVSDEMDKLSLKYYGTFQEIPGGDVVVPGGFQNLLQAVANELPPKCIQLNREVKKIIWNGVDNEMSSSPITIVCKDGSQWQSEYAIVTVSLGYLKNHHESLFCPQLPHPKIDAINKIGFGCTNKIFLEYDSPFWLSGALGFVGVAWSDDEQKDHKNAWEKSVYGFEEVYNNPNVLAAWIAGDGAEDMEQIPVDEVKEICSNLLRHITGNDTIPDPARVQKTGWRCDPYALGSYSYASTTSNSRDINNLARPLPSFQQPKLLFAGEATHPCYYSTVHGAFLSGIREAKLILQQNKKQDKSKL